MKQSYSREANSHSGIQEIHYCVHKSLPVDPNLNQMNAIHTLSSYFLMLSFP
jgi:hypothetical protein